MKSSYVRTKINKLINLTEIVTIHYYEFDYKFEFSGESHNFWEIVYVDSGSVEVIRNNEKIILKQGDILFHEPNEFHAIKSYNSCPNIFIISFVCKSVAMDCFKQFHTSLDKSLKPLISSIVIEAKNTYIIPQNDIKLKKLIINDNSPLGGEQLVKIYLEQFLILLARNISDKKDISIFPSREMLETHLVGEIKQYLKLKVSDKLNMEEICNHFGYSKTYLSQLFKSQCNISPMKYYNTQKIEYSKKLIRENKYNITQISNMLSFDNPQYFARVFKRITGLTPTEFMNSLNIKD